MAVDAERASRWPMADPRLASGIGWQRSGVLPSFAGVSCFLALIQVFTIGLGLAGIEMSQHLAVVILLISATAAWAFARRFREPESGSTASASNTGRVPVLDWVIKAAVVALLVWAGWVWVRLWALAAYRPLYDWDGLTYHVPAINAWVLRGHVAFIAGIPDVPVVNYPMGVELTSFITHYLFQTSRLVDACNLWYWPLAVTALAVTAAVLGARGIYRWLAGALVAGASVYVSQSVSAYVDPGFASAAMASVAAACVFVFDGPRKLVWKGALLGLTVGLMLGSKGYGLPFAAIVLAGTAVGALGLRGVGRCRVEIRALALALLVMLAVGGYWYIRNAVVTGNPIYPIQVAFGEKVIINGWDHRYFSQVDLPEWLGRYPAWTRPFVAWLQLDGPARSYGWMAGGLGYVWIVGAIPAIGLLWLLALQRRLPTPVAPLGFLTVMVVLLFMATDARWWARQTLWLHVVGLPCVAVVVSEAASRWRIDRRHLVSVALFLGLTALVVWESSRTLRLEWETGRDTRVNTRTAFLPTLEFHFSGLQSAPGFREALDSRIVARGRWSTGFGQLLGGTLSMPLGRREIVVLPPEMDAFRDPYKALSTREEPRDEEITWVQGRGVEWILWDEPTAGDLPESLSRHARERYVYRVEKHATFHLIRLSRALSDSSDDGVALEVGTP